MAESMTIAPAKGRGLKPANHLYTKTAYAKVPNLRGQEDKGEQAIAYVKLFSPRNGWRWYITEYDPETGMAFGLVQGHEVELGYIAVNADCDGDSMQEINNDWRYKQFVFPPFERDLHFTPATLQAIRESIKNDRPL